MIKHIKRKDLNTLKYDACIQNAINSRIYGLSSYLDIVADNWDVLVLNDYEAVMPLPWRSKYFLKYIYPPCWTQQLGVFSIKDFNSDLVNEFVNAIPKKFVKTTIQLNSSCNIQSASKKDNFILSLDQSYENLLKNYRKDRKDRLKKFNKLELSTETNVGIEEVISLFKTNYKGQLNLNNLDYKKLHSLALEKNLNPLVLGIRDNNGILISGSLFFKDKQRVYYVFSANNPQGNKAQGNTAILDQVIKNYSETNYTLDFEGSMIPGIASFFKSFGSKLEEYYFYENRFI